MGDSEKIAVQELDLAIDIRSQNFDIIRLASYRMAVKCRFVQRRTHLHLIDVWNLIEAYRENGLNAVEPYTPMTLSRLETLLATLYIHLNKRVPAGQQVHIHPASLYLLKWIISIYNLKDETDRIPVFTVKMVLAVLCGGKLADKLRYIFSQMSDSNGHLSVPKFEDFLRQCFALSSTLGEEPTFHYRPGMSENVFPSGSKVSVNEFLEVLLGDPCLPSLVWLPLVHRVAAAEHVIHSVECISCGRSPFTGLRYQCTRCPTAWSHQCQECFWRCLPLSKSHKSDHEVREYHTAKSPKRSSLGSTLRRSLRCVRSPASDVRDQTKVWRTLEGPERPVAVTYTPSTPTSGLHSWALGNCRDGNSTWKSNTSASASAASLSRSWSRGDDEHGLIARYAAKLAEKGCDETDPATGEAVTEQLVTPSGAHQLLTQLEAKNQEILREISRIRREQELEEAIDLSDSLASASGGGARPVLLMEELAVLRQRKDELEEQLTALQDSRKHLMVQLESLMKMIKNQQLSPRSSPSSASPSRGKSPQTSLGGLTESAQGSMHMLATLQLQAAAGNDSSPLSTDEITAATDEESVSDRLANLNIHWRKDLFSAADSVTDAMSSLVNEYNDDDSDEGANGINNDSI